MVWLCLRYEKAYQKAYYQKHKAKLLARSQERKKTLTQADKDKYLQTHYVWRNKNKEHIRELRLGRYNTSAGRARALVTSAKHRAKKLGLDYDITKEWMKEKIDVFLRLLKFHLI